MTSTFHLAIPAGDLAETKRFYCDVLGCIEGNQEAGRGLISILGQRADIASGEEQLPGVRHDVDMGNVSVPYGAHLSEADFQALKARSKRIRWSISMRLSPFCG